MTAPALAACEHASRELRRWIGPAGARALFSRAIAEAQVEHPVLKTLRAGDADGGVFANIEEITAQHGTVAVAKGLDALLVTLLALLGRLVGEDLAARLLDRGAPDPAHDEETGR